MEKTQDALVLPLDAGWSDVGSWSSLFDALPADEEGNVLQGDVMVYDTHDCYVHSTSRLVAAVGHGRSHHRGDQGCRAGGAQGSSPGREGTGGPDQEVGPQRIRVAPRGVPALGQLRQHRQWRALSGEAIEVKPGGVLSLQMHHHRAEHWIVVQGTARITCDDKTFLLSENESTYIPIGATHRIENPGKVALHIIEVQSGSYLGEDDIVRFEDNYGRKGTNT